MKPALSHIRAEPVKPGQQSIWATLGFELEQQRYNAPHWNSLQTMPFQEGVYVRQGTQDAERETDGKGRETRTHTFKDFEEG